MLPKTHIIAGAIFSLVLFLLFPYLKWFEILAVFLASFLIDIDHHLYYAFNKKDIGLKNSYNWFTKKRKVILSLRKEERMKFKRAILIFHGLEFILILILLIFIHRIFFFILIGILFHILLDLIEFYIVGEPLIFKVSQIATALINKNKKNFW